MDTFIRRLKYYGIGFGIGLLFVFFFFQNRGCSWLPGNRVKNSFLERVIVVPESQSQFMSDNNLTKEDIINVLNDGDVLYKKSIKKGSTKVYLIEKEFDKIGRINFFFTLPKESYLSEVYFNAGKASNVKNSTEGYGEIIHFPKDVNLIFVDTTDLATCQQDKLGLINPADIYKLIQKTGKVNFSKTNYKLHPKPEQYLEFKDKQNRLIGCKTIWYKNKINIISFDLPFEDDCK